jgi:hypothetical protein
MPPQQPQPPSPPTMTPGPGGNLDPNYGFIFNGQQQQAPGGRFKFPLLPAGGSKRILMFVLFGAIALIILIPIISSIFIKSGVNSKELKNVLARDQEITRVSKIVEQKSNDQNTKNLASTTQVALVSEQAQLGGYLSSVKVKVAPNDLRLYFDAKAESKILTSIQNNNLSTTYGIYLKNEIGKYQSALKAADVKAPNKAHVILQNGYTSSQAILSSSQVAKATTP